MGLPSVSGCMALLEVGTGHCPAIGTAFTHGIARRLLRDSCTHIALWSKQGEDAPQVIDYKCIKRRVALEWRRGYA